MKTTNVMEEKSGDAGTDVGKPVKKKLKQAQLSFTLVSPTNKKKRKLVEDAEKHNSSAVIVIDEDSEDKDVGKFAEKKAKLSDECNKQEADSENVVKNKRDSSKTDVPTYENDGIKKVANKEEKENKPINRHNDEEKKIHKFQSASGNVQCVTEEQNQVNCEERTAASETNQQQIDLTSSPSEKSDKDEVQTVQELQKNLKTPVRKKSLSPKTPKSASKEVKSLSPKTPKSASKEVKSLSPKTPKSASKEVRKLTPKQLQKQIVLEKKREEKELLKQEKEKLREEKEKLREKQKQERIKLKNEKEELKRREKEEKEKKRLAEIEQKNEEKRLKEEERKAKEEEKRAKEEEKRTKEEERKKKEEEKMAVKLKEAANFASFFVSRRIEKKSSLPELDEETEPVGIKFIPFEVKANMRVAPVTRVTLSEERKMKLDDYVNEQIEEENRDCLYISILKSVDYIPKSSSKTFPITDDDDVIIVESEKVEDDELGVNKDCTEENQYGKRVKRMRAKLLQFEENRRHPYWGTWRKKSQHIRPRAPFNQDKAMLEYEVDSDDEWEEEGEGESLRGSDDEESQDENYEEDNVMFVPHGYLSDEEAQDEVEDTSPEAQKLKLKFLQMEFEAERNEKQERLKPRLIGCVWFKNMDNDHEKVGSHIAELLLSRRAVFDGELPVTLCTDTCPPSPDSNSPSQDTLSSGPKKRVVPETAIPMVIKLLHGNTYNRKFVTKELCAQFKKQELKPLPSHTCVVDKIREIAEWIVCPVSEGPPLAGKKCWYVKEDVRKQYEFEHLNANNSSEWNYVCEVPKQSPATPREQQPSPQTPSHSRITKFTKVLSEEERKRLLIVNNSDNAVTPEIVDNQKTPTSSSSPLTPVAGNNKTVTPVAKRKKRAVLITVGPVQDKSRQAKSRNILQDFVKSPKAVGSDKTSETNSKDSSKLKNKTDSASGKTKDEECIVPSD